MEVITIPYIHFTDEQKQRANSVDLVDFLRSQGEEVTRSGHDFRWARHDSVTVRGNVGIITARIKADWRLISSASFTTWISPTQ